MFTSLSVKNFAIIEDITIQFKDGLTVLTGETGAGKSLIIDSIDLLLGERASTELIRNGEDKATITGVFHIDNKRLSLLLDKLDIEHPNNILEIKRTISNNKNIVKANGKNVTLNELKNISKYLADIHEQFDMIKLLNKDNYLDIVDGFRYELIEDYKNKYLSALELLKKEDEAYHALERRIKDIEEKRENYEYELKELKSLALQENEEEKINSEIALLKNYDKIYDLLKENQELIDKESLLDLYHIRNNIKKLSEYQPHTYDEYLTKLNDHYYELEELYEEIKYLYKHLDYDPNRLVELEERKQAITQIKRKYKKDVTELISYQKELESLLSSGEDLSIALNEQKNKLLEAYNNTYSYALDLSEIRKETAKNIEQELIANLQDLGLLTNFQIVFHTFKKEDEPNLNTFLTNGIDDIDFYIETNIGEGLKPLSKIASGGEISRIMLALKALYIKSHKIETVIFDEIDTGISGEIARKVARKIKEISLLSQVIIITHLPQVASLSTNHIKISKSIQNGRTYTSIKELTLEEKIHEIALMISDGKVTKAQLEYAKEMVFDEQK